MQRGLTFGNVCVGVNIGTIATSCGTGVSTSS